MRPPATRRRLLDRASRQSAVVRGGAVVCFIAVLCSMLWPWTSHGTGSSVPGHRLASLLLAGRADLWAPRWLGAALFLVPLSGSIGLAAVAFEGRGAAFAKLGAVTVGAAISLIVLGRLHNLSMSGIGPGGALALGGSIGASLFVVWGHRESRA